MPRLRRTRIPKLNFTKVRKLGFYASYTDLLKGTNRKKIFGNIPRKQAQLLYQEWLSQYLNDKAKSIPLRQRSGKSLMSSAPSSAIAASVSTLKASPALIPTQMASGSLKHVASNLLESERQRVRHEGQSRDQGTIDRRVYQERTKHVQDFLKFLNSRHKATGAMKLKDLEMQDVEAFNLWLTQSKADGGCGYSASQVQKSMQILKRLIDHAGRPEFGQQVLGWNWDSRHKNFGRKAVARKLPTLAQLQKILDACDPMHRVMVWLAIGCGLGPTDLSELRVNQIDSQSYNIPRQKTGIGRSGATPPRVWSEIKQYRAHHPRSGSDRLFQTKNGESLVHGRTNAVQLWWDRLRKKLGETGKTLSGFYVLRHLGATEYGSRQGMDSGRIKAWLGHAGGSEMVDIYQRPLAPEYKEVIEWVRAELQKA